MADINILGIDLGTTNSAIAIWDLEAGQPRVLSNKEGERLTPSVVMFDAAAQAFVVGRAAIEQMIEQPTNVAYSVKRFIGRTFSDMQVLQDQRNVTYTIEEAEKHKVVVRLGNRRCTPPQISAEILRKLREDAEVALGGSPIAQAVITVPAYFNESQRQATKEAGELAGLRVPRIINEPTAAALAFGLGAEPQTIAVYDLGGGTFDVSVLRIEHGVFRVKSTSGDTHLGGDDCDQAIVDWIATAFKTQHGQELPLSSNAQLYALLREEAKKAKIALTNSLDYVISLSNRLTKDAPTFDLNVTLTRSDLDELVQPLIKRSLAICDIALNKAGLTASDIDQVLLVGGQTRMPAVKAAIREHFNCKVNDSINPDEAIARGASILGARLCGHLKDKVKLWDVIPLSLGLELADRRMDQIISANQQIPFKSQPKYFTTQRDGQETIRFCVYQGERPIAKNNVFIGEVTLSLTTSRPAGEHRIKCVFSVDQDGILHVLAEDTNTDGEPVEEKFDHVYRMTQQEIDAVLEAANTHQDEDALTTQLFHLQEELQQLQQWLDQKKLVNPAISEQVKAFERAVSDRDIETAEKVIAKLKDML
ncbi:Hsp70 family protein [Leptolyngbya sp. CCY15150]|uniref:Hsp70 family protein n=1 Tax=Leptolyngbya sp. CCY15150 TaxID=2767772 RepID=UPI00194F660C